MKVGIFRGPIRCADGWLILVLKVHHSLLPFLVPQFRFGDKLRTFLTVCARNGLLFSIKGSRPGDDLDCVDLGSRAVGAILLLPLYMRNTSRNADLSHVHDGLAEVEEGDVSIGYRQTNSLRHDRYREGACRRPALLQLKD